ncbi:MAG TPA: phosphoribosylformylglycinamidine synthase subunit PurS [Candidatus Angelobacter sp.]|jgi:phosphoribosylformylglycinamidine synthase PurS subunit|nr:phosphoribosylformylglycinamidine synthase subunit PurS [Candidatus Angelobacter sp.]
MIFAVEVAVTLKPVVNDPQGLVVRDGLRQLGFAQVRSARVGKSIALELEASSEDEARASVVDMCEKLLRNPVIEDYHIESVSAAAGAAS